MHVTRSTLLGELRGFMQRASDDELRAFYVIASRVMGGGRDQYGPLHLANDARDFAKEAADEAADLLWYQAIRVVLDGYAAPASASPIAPSVETGAAPISSPSPGALSPSSGADSHGDTFIAIATTMGLRNVIADVVGEWAVHEDESTVLGVEWAITHVPTGMCVPPFLTLGMSKETALRVAKALGDEFPGVDPRAPGVGKKMSALLKQVASAPINRLGRACTDCGASDGDAHASGCGWITCVPPTEVAP